MTKTIESNRVIEGDCLEVLRTLPDESVNCVVTSPPYWALRDYGVDGQLGLEPTFQEYINKLCDIFDEVKRVLKKDGTCWVNMGDIYGGNMDRGNQRISGDHPRDCNCSYCSMRRPVVKNDLVESKCLVQIPSRFAIEMTNRGWILRNEIIWHKPNCMPSSVKDRFTVDFEKVFFFVKNKKYWFETQYENYVENSDMAYRKKLRCGRKYGVKRPYEDNQPLSHSKTPAIVNPQGRNKRTVWKVTTKPYKEAHFATYPEDLIEPMIKAGCPEGGIVLDPFFGAGTTGVVTKKQNKNYIGIELNPEYIKLAEDRIKSLPSRLL